LLILRACRQTQDRAQLAIHLDPKRAGLQQERHLPSASSVTPDHQRILHDGQTLEKEAAN
jgi:hypothetical protein